MLIRNEIDNRSVGEYLTCPYHVFHIRIVPEVGGALIGRISLFPCAHFFALRSRLKKKTETVTPHDIEHVSVG